MLLLVEPHEHKNLIQMATCNTLSGDKFQVVKLLCKENQKAKTEEQGAKLLDNLKVTNLTMMWETYSEKSKVDKNSILYVLLVYCHAILSKALFSTKAISPCYN